MFVDADVSFGSTASTNGQIYSNGTVTHNGTATRTSIAYGGYSGGVNASTNGAKVYSGATAVQTVLPERPDRLQPASSGRSPTS